jgi:hypothetical protein
MHSLASGAWCANLALRGRYPNGFITSLPAVRSADGFLKYLNGGATHEAWQELLLAVLSEGQTELPKAPRWICGGDWGLAENLSDINISKCSDELSPAIQLALLPVLKVGGKVILRGLVRVKIPP